MGAVVVTLVAALIMLIAAAGVMVARLMASVRDMTAALDATRQRLEPIVTELQENSEIASAEAEQLQQSIAALGARRNGHTT